MGQEWLISVIHWGNYCTDSELMGGQDAYVFHSSYLLDWCLTAELFCFPPAENGSVQSPVADGSHAEIGTETQSPRTSASSPNQRSHAWFKSHAQCCDERRTSCQMGCKKKKKEKRNRKIDLAAFANLGWGCARKENGTFCVWNESWKYGSSLEGRVGKQKCWYVLLPVVLCLFFYLHLSISHCNVHCRLAFECWQHATLLKL